MIDYLVTVPTVLLTVGAGFGFLGASKYRGLQRELFDANAERMRLNNALWATNSGVWEWNIGTDALIVNRQWSELTGLSASMTKTMSDWIECLQVGDRQQAKAYLNQCAQASAETWRQEFRVRYTNGKVAWLLARGKVTERGSDGSPRLMVGTVIDVTERKAGELRDSHRGRVLQMLATDTPLVQVLESIASDIKLVDEQMLCSISMSDPNGLLPFVSAAPDLPQFFIQALDHFALSQRQYIGVPASAKPQMVESIGNELSWAPFADLAERAGLVACWAQPILSSQGGVLGSFCVFLPYPCLPDRAQLLWLDEEARLTALAIERSTAATRQQLAASVFTHAREGISISDATGTIIDINETFTHITGYSKAEVVGVNPRLLKSGKHGDEFYSAMWNQLLQKGHWSGEFWNRRKNGEIYVQLTTVSAIHDASGQTTNYVSLCSDITSIKDHQRQLERIAHFDALTDLPNRVLLADRLGQGIAKAQRSGRAIAIAYLDLDGFKAVNDTYGHNIGDQLLVAVSHRMQAVMREGDTLARIGGDEFVAVLADLEKAEDSNHVLSRLLAAAAEPVTVGPRQLHVSASIGVTVYPGDRSDPDMLLRHADQAMYVAKQAGKNRVHFFDVVHDAAVQSHQETVTQLKQAIERNELLLYYQPKISLRTRAVVGFEALLRWAHPDNGLLQPGEFLPQVETNPVIVEIGNWVIEAALKQMTEWRSVGIELPVSVNIAALQLQQPTFVGRLREMLESYPDVSPALLEFEILETSALQDVAVVSEVMHACLCMGIRFALDDFGTGYSSMTYLKHLPATTLKIDRSFVRDMLSDSNDLSIVKSIIGLSAAFNRHVIAEGVESIDHTDLLASLGCELAQGFVIARPMPAAAVEAWLKEWPDAGFDSRSAVGASGSPIEPGTPALVRYGT